MSIELFLIVLFSLATFYLVIALFTSKKVSTVQDYFLANRDVGVLPLTFTLVGTQLGSGLLIGTAERAYTIGLWGILYTLGMSLGFIILGLGFAARLRSLNIATTAEIFETRYHSYRLKLFASFVSIISLWGLLLAQVIASKAILTGLDIVNPAWVVFLWSFLILYTMIGGLQSVIIIDSLQVIFIITIFTGIFFYTLPKGGVGVFTVPLLSKMQSYYFTKKFVLSSLLPTFLSPVLFSLIEQDLAQKFFAAKSKATATIASFLASIIITLFACIPLYFGIYAKIQGVVVPRGASPLIPFLAKSCDSVVFILAICGLMAAITSTADSLLSAISSNIAQDFSNFLPGKNKLKVAKSVTFITGASAVIASFYTTSDIITVLENSYRFSVASLFVPTIIAYFTTNLNRCAAVVSVCCGVLSFFGAHYFLPHSIWQDVIPLGLSLMGYIIGALLSEK